MVKLSLRWMTTIPLVLNGLVIFGGLGYGYGRHHSQVNNSIAQRLLQEKSRYLKTKLDSIVVPNTVDGYLEPQNREALMHQLDQEISLPIYDWERSGQNIATATLNRKEPHPADDDLAGADEIMQNSAQVILEQLTLNPALGNQTFDGFFQAQGQIHFFKFVTIASAPSPPWSVVIVLPAKHLEEINPFFDYSYGVILLLGLTVAVFTGEVLRRWLNDHVTNLDHYIDQSHGPQRLPPPGMLDLSRPALKEFDVLRVKISQLGELINATQSDLQQLRDRYDGKLVLVQQEAEMANRAKSAFIANMSHELRTPLNSIMVSAQILEMDPDLSIEAQEYVTIIYQSGQNLLKLINNLIDLSRLDNQRLQLAYKTIELEGLLDQLRVLFIARAKRKGLTLSFQVSEDVPTSFESDPLRLKEILANLIKNGIQYTSHGSVTVTINAVKLNPPEDSHSTQQYDLVLKVIDTGMGIKTEDLDTIFEPFRKLEINPTGNDGLGLSLTLSQKFAQLLGGQILVESQVNQGSIFTVRIPITVMDNAIPEGEGEPSVPLTFDPVETAGPSGEGLSPLSLDDLNLLPHQWLEHFHQASMEGDTDMMHELLAQIPPDQAAIAAKIAHKINQYELESLFELFEQLPHGI